MLIKGLVDEDFVNYKVPSMYICTNTCSFKCDKESGTSCCQNSSLARATSTAIDDDTIIRRYLSNPITKAIVFAGLEPMEQFDEMFAFIKQLRTVYHCYDTVVIYTGFNKSEVLSMVEALEPFGNIIVKFGRYIPNNEKRYDDTLGVYLASSNQYAEVIC